MFTPAVWNLQTIIQEFRGITGRPDASMLSDAQCAYYINLFYQYVLPKELKIFWGYTNYFFFTISGVDQYPAPSQYQFQTFNPQAYVDGFPLEWYIDPDTFYQDYPQKENKMVVAQGDGSTNSFSFNAAAYPVLPRSVYVTDGTQVVQDVPIGPDQTTGTFVSYPSNIAVAGTIFYATGTIAGLAFPSAPAANTNITASSFTYMPNRPQGILYFSQTPLPDATAASILAEQFFVLRPVPDQTYKVQMQVIQVPQAMVNLTDVPFRADLGPLIALGASLHLFKVFNQMDQYEQYVDEFKRFRDVSMQDTYEEYLYQRSISKF